MVFSFPIDPVSYFAIVPEVNVSPQAQQAMMRTRTGALIGSELAKKYGWKVGDRVPLHSVIWTKTRRRLRLGVRHRRHLHLAQQPVQQPLPAESQLLR